MTEHDVVIAGGGPTGLVLGAELQLAGVDVAIVERRRSQELDGSRAGGLHTRTIEVLDQRGVAERFLAAGTMHRGPGFPFWGVAPDFDALASRHAGVLALWQSEIERILADWVLGELGVPILRGREVVGLGQDDTGVDVALSDGESIRGRYLVGCDGGRSVVRKAAGIDFAGWDARTHLLVAEVEMGGEPELGLRRGPDGVHALGALDDGHVRLVVPDPAPHAATPTLAELSAALVAARGTDYGLRSARFISRFSDMTRQAVAYRAGRVLLAGDAAHVHSPAGGQGLNIGVQDAVNLGWKLAQVVQGTSSDSLLDTYHAERHPVAERVLRHTMAQSTLQRSDPWLDAVRDTFADLLTLDQARVQLGGLISGLDVHYDLGEGHPLLGRRMPDVDLVTSAGPLRTYSLLHGARPVLINLGAPGSVELGPWAERVRLVDATSAEAWELPVVGAVRPPTAVLVRPDGYVGWVGEGSTDGLHDALRTWCGD